MGVCDHKTHKYANYIMKLINLTDTQLQSMNSELKTQNDAIVYRQNLTDVLYKLIPGTMYTECAILNWIWLLYPPILLLLGSVGNILVIIVLIKRKLIGKLSTYIYLVVLAFIDEFILILGLFRRWIDRISGVSYENRWLFWCQFVQFIGVSSSLISVWLIVSVTAERLIVIKMPFKAHSFVTKRRTKLIIIIIFIFSLIISSHFFYTVSLVHKLPKNKSIKSKNQTSGYRICDFNPDYMLFARIWTFIDAILYSCLPLILMIGMNVIIGVSLYQAHLKRNNLVHLNNNNNNDNTRRNTNNVNDLTNTQLITPTNIELEDRANKSFKLSNSHQNSTSNRETKQLTIVLLMVSCVFLITTTPLVSLKFYIKLPIMNIRSNKHKVIMDLLDTIFEMLMYTNHAINFLLYCIFGKRFRQHVKAFLRSGWCRLCSDNYNDDNNNMRHESNIMYRSKLQSYNTIM